MGPQRRRRASFYFANPGFPCKMHKSGCWAISAAVAQLLYTELVGGSNPSSPTTLGQLTVQSYENDSYDGARGRIGCWRDADIQPDSQRAGSPRPEDQRESQGPEEESRRNAYACANQRTAAKAKVKVGLAPAAQLIGGLTPNRTLFSDRPGRFHTCSRKLRRSDPV